MVYISSIGTSLPEYELTQETIKGFIHDIFNRSEKELNRLMPVFDNANIDKRQFVVPQEWFYEEHSFMERNRLYQEQTLKHSLSAIDQCLANEQFLEKTIPYEAIDTIIFVSSTGLSTPSIDAHIINQREFREDIIRIPIWGLGCAGGAAGLARAFDWLSYHTTGCALVVCAELCSLTFQKEDTKKSNFIGTALFGDGIAAALMVGKDSPYNQYCYSLRPKVKQSSSRIKKGSLDVMGWDISAHGFEVIFAKSIPHLVETFWKEHIDNFLDQQQLTKQDISFFVAHPGGTKVLESMKSVMSIDKTALYYSYEVLKQHGNMSSVTVLYILNEWMKQKRKEGDKSILSALGPGFSSELISMEWCE